ncbi:MAG: helix-turn-helix domain-containing protein [Bacteroidales bacterium]
MLFSSLYFGFSLSYYYANYNILTYTYYLSLPVVLSFFPIFYLYIQSVTQRNFIFSNKELFHFIPAIFILILNLPYLFLSFEEKYWFVSGGYSQITDNSIIIYLRTINRLGVFGIINLQLLIYIILSVYFYKHYKYEIENIFSYKENVDLKWIKVLIVFFIILFIMIDTVHFFSIKTNVPNRILFNASMLVFNIFIFAYGLYQKNIFTKPDLLDIKNLVFLPEVKRETAVNDIFTEKEDLTILDIEDEKTNPKYQKSSLTFDQKTHIIEALDKYMKNKPYYYSNLTIDEVAEALQTNSKYLSQVINESYQKNFYTYINIFRINDSMEMLLSNQFENYSMEGIAKTVGFNSKSSFYSAFKKYTGYTPTEFKKKEESFKT